MTPPSDEFSDSPPPLSIARSSSKASPPSSNVPRRIGSVAVVPSLLKRSPPVVNAPAAGRAAAPSETIPNFVKQYYETSTFHHLSSWRLKYQQMTSDILQGKRSRLSENQAQFEDEPNFEEINPSIAGAPAQTVVFHVDLDCFYVSVAIRDNPALAGKPVAVCPASKFQGTSEIASASYEARAFGIKSRMHVGEARKLCPDLICVPCNFPEYEKVSLRMYEIFTRHTNRVLAVSADEAYLDMSSFPDPIKAAEALRAEIKATTGCTASIGISHNMLLARIATKKAKPNGVLHITQETFFDLLADIEVKDLPGFGPATVDKLKRRGITLVKQLRTLSKEALQNDFGKKHGEMMWKCARGIDERVIAVQQHVRKSVGTQISWGVRFQELPQLERFLHDVAVEVQRRMREVGAKGRRINIRIKKRAEDAPEPTKLFNPGQHSIIHKSVTLAEPTDDAEVIARECIRMFKQSRVAVVDFRGVGLSIDQLEGPRSSHPPKRLRTLDDMLKKPKDAPPPAAAGAAAVVAPAAAGGVKDDGDDEKMKDAPLAFEPDDHPLMMHGEEQSFEFATISSESAPSTTLSPEEAAREAELLRDRQPSPDLWEYSPPSPVRPEELQVKIEAASQRATQATQTTQSSSSTSEALRNVVLATEEQSELFEPSQMSPSPPEVILLLSPPPSLPRPPPPPPPPPAAAASIRGQSNQVAAIQLAAPATRGRGRGGAGAGGPARGRGRGQRFRQLDLGSFRGGT